MHFKAEGDVEFRALLYVPDRAPYRFMDEYYAAKAGVKLYVRRVFISDEFEDLIPRCASHYSLPYDKRGKPHQFTVRPSPNQFRT